MRKLLFAFFLSCASFAQADILIPPGGGGISTLTSGSTATSGFSNGQLFYSNGSTLQALGQGLSGQFLQSAGAGVLPTWANASGTGTVASCSQYSVGVYLATGTTVSCSPNLLLNGALLEIGANGTPGSLLYWGASLGQYTTVGASTYGGATSFVWPYAPGGVLAIEPRTTAGDTDYQTSSGVPARLPIGSVGNCYIVSGSSLPSWGACPVNIVAGTSTASGFSGPQLFAVTAGGVIQPVTVGANLTLSGSGPFTLSASGGGGGTVAWNQHVGGILTYVSTTSVSVTAGQFADTSNAVYIAPSANAGMTLTSGAAGACGGLDVSGVGLQASAFYNVWAISNSSNASPCYIASVDWAPVTANASWTTSNNTITLSANCPAWVVTGMVVYDTTYNSTSTSTLADNAVIGTVSSCPTSGATLTLSANAAFASVGSTDALRLIIPNATTGPAMPSGYSGGYFRIAGAFKTNGSSQVVSFQQDGDLVELSTSTTENQSVPGVTNGHQFPFLGVPAGYRVKPLHNYGGSFSGGNTVTEYSGDNANNAINAQNGNFANAPGNDYYSVSNQSVRGVDHFTDIYGRMRFQLGTTSANLYLYSRGWTFDWRQY